MAQMTGKDALKEAEYTYDQKFKQLFQNKKFLAPILKNVVKEYRELPLPVIEGLIFSVEGNEEVAANIGAEDVGKGGEAKSYYDVLAGCRLPDTEGTFIVDLYFDLEMQRERNVGYPIPKRGVYYCSRMLSRQLTNLKDADYGMLKPVYSVWIIVNNIPKALQYSRYEVCLAGASSRTGDSKSYSAKKKAKFDAAVRELDGQIDLIHLCLVYLSEDFTSLDETGDTLIRYIQSVLIKKVGDPEYNPYAEYSVSIKKEADDIMTIVGMFAEIAEKRGEKRGEEIGEKRGKEIGEKRGEKRGEDRLKKLLRYLKQQGREEDINQIIVSENNQLLEELYSELNL